MIEIEASKSDGIYNIRKNIQLGFNKIITVAIYNATYDDILKNLKESGLNNCIKLELKLAINLEKKH